VNQHFTAFGHIMVNEGRVPSLSVQSDKNFMRVGVQSRLNHRLNLLFEKCLSKLRLNRRLTSVYFRGSPADAAMIKNGKVSDVGHIGFGRILLRDQGVVRS
jgi:hypothetical protein